jgi:magnesium chelatase family protein
MPLAEAIETTRLHRVAGLTGDRPAMVTTRPCRPPHHTISDVGLIGGGQVPTPGEVSLAHSTSLDLDELSEWVYLIHYAQAPPVVADLGFPHT